MNEKISQMTSLASEDIADFDYLVVKIDGSTEYFELSMSSWQKSTTATLATNLTLHSSILKDVHV